MLEISGSPRPSTSVPGPLRPLQRLVFEPLAHPPTALPSITTRPATEALPMTLR